MYCSSVTLTRYNEFIQCVHEKINLCSEFEGCSSNSHMSANIHPVISNFKYTQMHFALLITSYEHCYIVRLIFTAYFFHM